METRIGVTVQGRRFEAEVGATGGECWLRFDEGVDYPGEAVAALVARYRRVTGVGTMTGNTMISDLEARTTEETWL
jgi:hypothetical protein